jgi:hypothetical protein
MTVREELTESAYTQKPFNISTYMLMSCRMAYTSPQPDTTIRLVVFCEAHFKTKLGPYSLL